MTRCSGKTICDKQPRACLPWWSTCGSMSLVIDANLESLACNPMVARMRTLLALSLDVANHAMPSKEIWHSHHGVQSWMRKTVQGGEHHGGIVEKFFGIIQWIGSGGFMLGDSLDLTCFNGSKKKFKCRSLMVSICRARFVSCDCSPIAWSPLI